MADQQVGRQLVESDDCEARTINSPPAGLIWLGVATNGNMSDLDTFETDAGTTASALYGAYKKLTDNFDFTLVGEVRAREMAPLITLDPPSENFNGLAAIVRGEYDASIEYWAKYARSWGHPLFLSFAHEMNGFWYPWGTAIDPNTQAPPNGNTAQAYVEAWRHVHGIFETNNANNVTKVWAPNVVFRGSTPLTDLYPGDDYVDWVGVSGYNWGSWPESGTSQPPNSNWKWFAEVFDETLTELAQIAPSKPLLITETATVEDEDFQKTAWIADCFEQLAARPAIRGFVWFNIDKRLDREPDWRFQSWDGIPSEGSRQAFVTGLGTLNLAPAPLRRRDTR